MLALVTSGVLYVLNEEYSKGVLHNEVSYTVQETDDITETFEFNFTVTDDSWGITNVAFEEDSAELYFNIYAAGNAPES